MSINHKPIRSFVRRERRMTKEREANFQQLWQCYGLTIADGICDARKVFQNQAPTILEIGFGDGEALLAAARANPHHNYIGIEVYRPGVEAVLHALDKENIPNVRVYSEDALLVLEKALPDASLAAILLFFSDPWPKRCHHKRRLVRSLFIDLISNKLHQVGYFHFATDWEDYAEHVAKLMQKDTRFACCVYDCILYPRPSTKFERTGIKAGRGIYDLVYSSI